MSNPLSLYEKTNERLNWLLSFENKLLNNSVATKISEKVDEKIQSGIDGLYQSAGASKKAYYDTPADNQTSWFWTACRTSTSVWNWVKNLAHETLQSTPITSEIVSKGATQIALEDLNIDVIQGKNLDADRTKLYSLGHAHDVLLKALPAVNAGAPAPANPTTKEVITETVKEGVHQGTKWGLRYFATGIVGMFFPEVPVIIYLAQWGLFGAYTAGVYNQYVNPPHGEAGSILTKREIQVITDHVKAQGNTFKSNGTWNAQSLINFEAKLAKLSRKDLLDAVDRYKAIFEPNNTPAPAASASAASGKALAGSGASPAAAPAKPAASAKPAAAKGPHMYDVTVDLRDPSKNPEVLRFKYDEKFSEYTTAHKQKGPKDILTLKANFEAAKLRFELSKYEQENHDNIRAHHNEVFEAKIAILNSEKKLLDALDVELKLFDSLSQYFTQEGRHDEALNAKRDQFKKLADRKNLEIVLARPQGTVQTAADLDQEAIQYDIALIQINYDEALMIANHYELLEDYAELVGALEDLKKYTIDYMLLKYQADPQDVRDIQINQALQAIEARLLNAFDKQKNEGAITATLLRQHDHAIDLLRFEKKPVGVINQAIIDKWAFALTRAKDTRDPALETEAQVNLAAYSPDLRSANRNPVAEIEIWMNASINAYDYYTQRRQSLEAQPFLEMYFVAIKDLINAAKPTDAESLVLFENLKKQLDHQLHYLTQDMMQLRPDQEARRNSIRAKISWIDNTLQFTIRAITTLNANLAASAAPGVPASPVRATVTSHYQSSVRPALSGSSLSGSVARQPVSNASIAVAANAPSMTGSVLRRSVVPTGVPSAVNSSIRPTPTPTPTSNANVNAGPAVHRTTIPAFPAFPVSNSSRNPKPTTPPTTPSKN